MPAGRGGARPTVAIANPAVAILVPRKNALMSFKEFMRRKGEEIIPLPLLAGSFTGSMKPGNVVIKPNCIVYIIRIQ
jgi:hypothetical protein